MTQNIIALVDGSGYAASVCEHAAWVSQLTGAPVQLLHVMGRRDAAGPQDLSGAIRLGARTALLDELAKLDSQRARIANEAGRALLDDARQLTEGAGATTVTTRLEQGDLIDRTVGHEAADTAMIVIGKRGTAADFAKGHLGSNLERIVRSARKPVLVASRAFKPIRKVLVAFDGGASSMKAVEHIAANPIFADLTIDLAMAGNANNNAQTALEEALLRLRAAGLNAYSSLLEGAADTALSAKIESEGYDLLVMGAYGHSRIRSMIIGSTTTQMLIACKVPVLLFR
ncbi:universal stress protein [Paracoccus sp. JM45]|uniref:universal stress protein n=1 Tax=Paracoccus sp. JM45 TaxID=2283626 RepID=UPI000E6D3BF6|nr:universal stress protein [Paracoccus sp. JM45]RJE80122.1 universal stress protein [Paracoccus sp. JM45]